jgi:uncharacterized protein
MKKIYLLLILIIPLILSACQDDNIKGDSTQKYLIANNQKIFLEIADTPEKRARGLSNKDSLPEDHGMLFIFPRRSRPAFWMKDMLFPIDIIWIKDDSIIAIDKNVPAPVSDTLDHYLPPEKIDYVLEINANLSDKYNLKVGDIIKGLDLI